MEHGTNLVHKEGLGVVGQCAVLLPEVAWQGVALLRSF